MSASSLPPPHPRTLLPCPPSGKDAGRRQHRWAPALGTPPHTPGGLLVKAGCVRGWILSRLEQRPPWWPSLPSAPACPSLPVGWLLGVVFCSFLPRFFPPYLTREVSVEEEDVLALLNVTVAQLLSPFPPGQLNDGRFQSHGTHRSTQSSACTQVPDSHEDDESEEGVGLGNTAVIRELAMGAVAGGMLFQETPMPGRT